MRLDLRLQIGDLLLGGGDGIGARDEAARRSFLARDRDERVRELRRVPGLLSVLGFPVLDLRPSALVVVGDRRLGIVRRLLREQFGAEEPGLTMVVLMPNGATSAWSDSIQPSRPNFDAA